MNIWPQYPPAGAPLAPVPAEPMRPGAYPSGVPASPAPSSRVDEPAHDMGVVHGIQSKRTWKPGDNKRQIALDARRASNLWRVTALGPEGLAVDLKYGPQCTVTLVGLALPLRVSAPGQFQLIAYPTADHDTELVLNVTMTPATSGGLIEAARLKTVAGAFDDNALRFTALTASTVLIRGIGPIAVGVLESVRLLAGSSLVTGSGYEEFDT